MPVAMEYPPNKAYSLPAEVEAGKTLTVSHGNMQFKARIDDRIVVPYQSLIGRYHSILREYIVERTFTEKEFARFSQRPKLLSMELYGTPELWSWLLYINNCKSAANFVNPTLKIFTPDIGTAITEILTISNSDMTTNKKEVYPEE